MGKGDKKSKKGKRFMGSYGNSRRKSAIKARMKRNLTPKSQPAAVVAEEKPKAKRTTKKKAETAE